MGQTRAEIPQNVAECLCWQVARHDDSRVARRLEIEVVGITGLTTDDHDGTDAHGRHANRRDFEANPINAVVVRQWHGRDYGPGREPRRSDQRLGAAAPAAV